MALELSSVPDARSAMTSRPEFEALVDAAEAQTFAGWDFSFLSGRMLESEPSWGFRDWVAQNLSHSSVMLDMHTGGGEFLDSFTYLPPTTIATEGFAPNLLLARERLGRRGVEVLQVASDKALPVQDNTFDLVTNRHGSYDAAELRRIMRKQGSVFITQQVGSDNLVELNQALGAVPADNHIWNLSVAIDQLESQGFTIRRQQEERLPTSFTDIGAVVYYLLAVPWQITAFSVAKYRDGLLALHKRIESEGAFEASAHRFLIEACFDDHG